MDGLLATVTELDVVGSGAHPQLRQWQPERTGQIDISIKRNGDWFHEGVRIDRQRMVQLFASIMRKDSDG
ncbi:MAG: DUF1285 domain-containing protein, partial [Gammaproteobacteria bacterium]|nr:DUF1285 domain-containing protein [Gammaproteobacteria bacterium]